VTVWGQGRGHSNVAAGGISWGPEWGGRRWSRGGDREHSDKWGRLMPARVACHLTCSCLRSQTLGKRREWHLMSF
jgi:hypothetical protein